MERSPPQSSGQIRRIHNLRRGNGGPPYPLGRVQRIALRLLRRARGPIGTVEVAQATHSLRRRRGQSIAGCRTPVICALDRFAVRVGRRARGEILWVIRPEYVRSSVGFSQEPEKE
jgi:hypothetical protein